MKRGAAGHNICKESETIYAYLAQALPPIEAVAAEAHLAACQDCQKEAEKILPVIDLLVAWPTDVLRPATRLEEHISGRIAAHTGKPFLLPPPAKWFGPDWEEVAPGITCRVLAADAQKSRVSMLVRLAPHAAYPAHRHADVEELHLLEGELWIDERKLFPGNYSYGAPGTGDERVWSETGCTCLLITSTKDLLV